MTESSHGCDILDSAVFLRIYKSSTALFPRLHNLMKTLLGEFST